MSIDTTCPTCGRKVSWGAANEVRLQNALERAEKASVMHDEQPQLTWGQIAYKCGYRSGLNASRAVRRFKAGLFVAQRSEFDA